MAFDVIAAANYIRVLGYSLPTNDTYVRYLVKSALVNCKHLKSFDVIVLDRDGAVETRYREFVDPKLLKFQNRRLETYLQDIKSLNGLGTGTKFDRLEEAHSFFMKGAV